MNTLIQHPEFASWLRGLRDHDGRMRILARLRSAAAGHFGDAKTVGGGVSEMRIRAGPGYRVYFTGAAMPSICCWRAATNPRNPRISPAPSSGRKSGRTEP